MDKITVENYSFYYQNHQAIKDISLKVKSNRILSIIGPARSGKTTLLRSINRLNDLNPFAMQSGRILLDGVDIYGKGMNVPLLRKRVGMVFAVPIPLPKSIYENLVYGLRLHGIKGSLNEKVEKSLKSAFLWDEVKARLHTSALKLSGGQQQRLCLARTLILEPEVLLLDEPCSGLDPISTAKIEEALLELKKNYTIILVTNNTKQAARVSDEIAFLLMGELIEDGATGEVFTVPKDKRTEDYLSGRFG